MRQNTDRPPDHLARLDGLRGLAVLFVVAGHVGDFSLGFHRLGELGGVGVLFFVLLSGYLITGSLDRERDRDGRIDLHEFYLRRAVRILPAFWVLLAVVCILKLIGPVSDVTWKAVLACLFFVRNIRGRGQSLSHIWTLSLLGQFYLCWPIAMKRLTRKHAFLVAAAISLACVLWRTYAIATHMYPYETDVFYLRTDFRLDSILVGCCLALAFRDAGKRAMLTGIFDRVPFSVAIPALCAWALSASVVTVLQPLFLTVETILALLIFGRLITRERTAAAVRLCSRPELVMLGRMSLSIFLWQQIFIVPHEPSWRVIGEFPFNLVSIAIASTLSYVLVEKPALKLHRRWSRARQAAIPVVSVA